MEGAVQDPPSQFKTIGVINLIGGVLNGTLGFFIAGMIWGIAGTGLGTVFLMCGCPIGFALWLVPFVMPLVGLLEILVGVLILAAPGAVKGIMRFVPFLQFPSILIGDFISPIIGGISLFMLSDAEVKAYIQG